MKKNPTSLNPVKTVFSAGGGFFMPVETRTADRGLGVPVVPRAGYDP